MRRILARAVEFVQAELASFRPFVAALAGEGGVGDIFTEALLGKLPAADDSTQHVSMDTQMQNMHGAVCSFIIPFGRAGVTYEIKINEVLVGPRIAMLAPLFLQLGQYIVHVRTVRGFDSAEIDPADFSAQC
eukprot:11412021-Alexandrium_andersonii.AAC.1